MRDGGGILLIALCGFVMFTKGFVQQVGVKTFIVVKKPRERINTEAWKNQKDWHIPLNPYLIKKYCKGFLYVLKFIGKVFLFFYNFTLLIITIIVINVIKINISF